jgi:PAS domain S-box-containing protein
MAETNTKRTIQLKIGTKIFGGFLALILLFAIIAAIIFGTVNSINTIVDNNSNVVNPTRDAINDWVTMVTRSRMLITNWVYLSTNDEDKQSLNLLEESEYPALKGRLEKLLPEIPRVRRELDSLVKKRVKIDTARYDTSIFLAATASTRYIELLSGSKENIQEQLISFESYEDPTAKLLAGDYVDQVVIPESNEIIKILNELLERQTKITKQSENELKASMQSLKNITTITGIAVIAMGLLFAYLLMRNITVPINYIRDIVVKMGRGELVEDKGAKFGRDEIGEMAVAMDKLVNGLKATTMFAKNIGDGKYDSEFKPLSDHDVLGNALLEMRANLARVAEEDKKRNWTTEGLAKFGEILRENTNDVNKLCDTVVGNLVKYLGANQGALYLVDDMEAEEPTVSLMSCYAWDKKKFINQQIHRGEGLIGQAWQEKDIIFLTDVPNNYIRITSGLGDANPNCVLIVPLKVNDQIFGVVELASFNVIRDFEIEFVKKIAETMASTISTVKVNAKTQKLLELTEQMRAQEEEMRQNMEELQATQEEMERGQAESESNMNAINASVAVCEFSLDGTIQKANQNFLSAFGYAQSEITGEAHKSLLHRDDKNYQDYRAFLAALAQGRPWKGELKRANKRGDVLWTWSSFNPVKNKSGEISRVMEISVEITAFK